jgi:hypothetical protein
VAPGYWVGLPGVSRRPPGLAPRFGEHGDAILREHGVAVAPAEAVAP